MEKPIINEMKEMMPKWGNICSTQTGSGLTSLICKQHLQIKEEETNYQ